MPPLFKRSIRLAIFIFLLFGGMRGAYAHFSADSATERYGSGKSPVLSLYQRYISPVKGGNTCAMYPSCSQYAKYAFARLDPFSAFFASCDRVVRCGRDLTDYPLVATGDGRRRYDSPASDRPPEIIPLASNATAQSDSGDTGCARLAMQLQSERKYVLASLEFERIAHAAAGSECGKAALEGILTCSYRSDDIGLFLDNFYRVTDSLREDTAAVSRCGVLLAKRYFGAESYGDMQGALRHYVGSKDLLADRQFLFTLCRLMTRRPGEALAAADSIPRESRLSVLGDSLRHGIAGFYHGEPSPPVAGLLSTIFPGAGYLYCGKRSTAAASLMINGLFIWTTCDFAKNGHYAAAATSFFLCSGFYFGNITGSIKAAKRRAIEKRKKRCASIIDDLRYEW